MDKRACTARHAYVRGRCRPAHSIAEWGALQVQAVLAQATDARPRFWASGSHAGKAAAMLNALLFMV